MTIESKYKSVYGVFQVINRLKSQNAKLREALQAIVSQTVMTEYNAHCFKNAREALKNNEQHEKGQSNA